MRAILKPLRQRNALNLDVNVLGKSLDGDTAAGRLVGEPLGVLLVHVLEFVTMSAVNVTGLSMV